MSANKSIHATFKQLMIGLIHDGLYQLTFDTGELSMKFRPLHDRVVVKRLEEDQKTAGGIIIPDSAQEKPQTGEVLAVGNGIKNDNGDVSPLDVKAGDTILFGKWSGTEVKIDGDDLLIMKESDIMGVLS